MGTRGMRAPISSGSTRGSLGRECDPGWHPCPASASAMPRDVGEGPGLPDDTRLPAACSSKTSRSHARRARRHRRRPAVRLRRTTEGKAKCRRDPSCRDGRAHVKRRSLLAATRCRWPLCSTQRSSLRGRRCAATGTEAVRPLPLCSRRAPARGALRDRAGAGGEVWSAASSRRAPSELAGRGVSGCSATRCDVGATVSFRTSPKRLTAHSA